MKRSAWLLAAILISIFASVPARAADNDKLAGILIPGEDWQIAIQGIGFADGLSCDPASGSIYFSDMKGKDADKPGIYSLSPTLEKKRLFDGKYSGTRLSADGKTLYAIGDKKLVSFELPNGAEKLLADKIGTNDLAVTRDGRVYFTGHGKGQVSMFDPKTKAVSAADVGSLKNPNGIGLSPDQKTLIVSDYAGVNVWTFAVQPDGKLADKKPAMKMNAPEKKPDVANGDGMGIDSTGRAYVTTALGLQIFSPTGELLGVLPKPKPGSLISCTFGGKDLDYLYVSCGDTVYRRKVAAKGIASNVK
ncbi:MAG TPA: SMP-30/gluconolactonase/LRE family protein [Tepidisphaeraceae bacterium]|jgi:enterochelin esterase family protein